MKVAATFLLSVTVFTTLFLESSIALVGTADKVVGDVGTVVDDAIEAVAAKAGQDVETVKLATNVVAIVPIERVVATVNAITGEVKETLNTALDKIKSTLRRELLVKPVQEQVTNVFIVNNAALDDIIKAVAEALAKAKGPEKEPLTLVLNWLEPLVDLSASVENTMNDALTKDTTEDLQNAITVLDQAIVEADENLTKFVGTLEKSPSKLVKSVKPVVKNNMDSILVYAKDNLKSFRSLLTGDEQDAAASDVNL